MGDGVIWPLVHPPHPQTSHFQQRTFAGALGCWGTKPKLGFRSQPPPRAHRHRRLPPPPPTAPSLGEPQPSLTTPPSPPPPGSPCCQPALGLSGLCCLCPVDGNWVGLPPRQGKWGLSGLGRPQAWLPCSCSFQVPPGLCVMFAIKRLAAPHVAAPLLPAWWRCNGGLQAVPLGQLLSEASPALVLNTTGPALTTCQAWGERLSRLCIPQLLGPGQGMCSRESQRQPGARVSSAPR